MIWTSFALTSASLPITVWPYVCLEKASASRLSSSRRSGLARPMRNSPRTAPASFLNDLHDAGAPTV